MSRRRRKRTGNHTTNSQWLYLLIHIPCIWWVKLGVSGKIERRLGAISSRVPGFAIPILMIWIPYAYQIEQWALDQTKFLKTSVFGSGGREWRLFPSLLLFIPLILFLIILKWALIIGLTVGAFYLVS